MSNRKQRDQNRANAHQFKKLNPCPNCGELTSGHFAPPSFGDEGFYVCHVGEGPYPKVGAGQIEAS